MTFYEVLEQVLTLLQQHGRVSYRALKRQFALDDDYIEDLKAELIQARRLAVDEQGAVLVWSGGAAGSPELPSSGSQPAPPALQEARALPSDVPTTVARPTEAERRQLTVLFCDLVDSTLLARQLDPEELRDVVRAYQAACARVIARFEGHIAQYLGDGLLVYFGYPRAHEGDAQRTVRAGLGMIEALGQLNTRLGEEGLCRADAELAATRCAPPAPTRSRQRGVHLAVCLGVHTGLVVVGEVGGGTRQEQLALGETPNLAARLQGLAAPNTLVISAATLQLLRGFFACQLLGTPLLKGFAQPLEVYQVLSESTARSRLDVVGRTGLTPLVGREQEVGLLLERWAQVKDGLGQAGGTMMRGWTLTAQGQGEEGIAQMHQGLTAWRAMRIEAGLPYWLAMLAEAYESTGQVEAGMRVLAESLSLVDTTEEHWWAAELHRLKGELLLALSTNNTTEAETCFRRALALASRQQAKSLELRAAMSLSGLWQHNGKRAKAQALLAPIYAWFTEGFDTADLREARELLAALS